MRQFLRNRLLMLRIKFFWSFVHAVVVGIAAAIAAKLLVGAAYYFFSALRTLFGTHN
jgi:hypothetical protein